MATRVMIDRLFLNPDREGAMGQDDIEALAINIRDSGMRHPILVVSGPDDTFRIIDGISRVEAASKLGHVTIEAMVVSDLEQACNELRKVNKGRELNPRRVWEISVALEEIWAKRGNKRRGRQVEDNRTGSDLVGEALGYSSANLKDIRATYRFGVHTEMGLVAIAEMEAGTRGVVSARTLAYKAFKLAEIPVRTIPATGAEVRRQQGVLSSVARSLGTTIKTAKTEAFPVHLPPEDLNEILQELYIRRRDLSAFIHALEKEAKQ